MTVDIHCELNTAVPKLILDVGKGLAVLNQQGGVISSVFPPKRRSNNHSLHKSR